MDSLPTTPWTVGSHDDWVLGFEGCGNAAGLFILNSSGNVVGAAMQTHEGVEPPREELKTRAALFAASPALLDRAERLLEALDGSAAQVAYAAGRLREVIAQVRERS